MMIEKVNAAGGVNGMKVEVEYMDEQCEPKEAATVASKIAMDTSIVGVVGHVCSSAHLAALPTLCAQGRAGHHRHRHQRHHQPEER